MNKIILFQALSVVTLSLLLCVYVFAGDLHGSCAKQFKPVVDHGSDLETASFVFRAVKASNPLYYEALVSAMKARDEVAFEWGTRFSVECLTSGQTVNEVINTMRALYPLKGDF